MTIQFEFENSHINTEKYNDLLAVSTRKKGYEIFCKKCYRLLGYNYGGATTYEDKIIHLLIMKYYFSLS